MITGRFISIFAFLHTVGLLTVTTNAMNATESTTDITSTSTTTTSTSATITMPPSMMAKRVVLLTFNDRDDVVRLKADSSVDLSTVHAVHRFLVSQSKHSNCEGIDVEELEFIDPASGENFFKKIDTSGAVNWTTNFLYVFVNSALTSKEAPVLCLKGRAFDTSAGLEIYNNIRNETFRLNIFERDKGADLGTGLITWDASVVLGKFLETHQELVADHTVIELGAGTGIAGLAASVLGASQVLLTDLEYALDNLRRNVDENMENLRRARGFAPVEASAPSLSNGDDTAIVVSAHTANLRAEVSVALLDWGDTSTYRQPCHPFARTSPSLLGKEATGDVDNEAEAEAEAVAGERIEATWDVMLGADVVWLEELVPLLVGAMAALCGRHTVLLLAHQVDPREHHPVYQSDKIHIFRGRKRS